MGVYRSLNYQQLYLLLLFVYMCKNVHGLLVVQRCEWDIPAPSFPSPNLLIFIQQRVPLIMANVLFMHPYTRAIAGHKDGKPIFDVNSNIFRFCIRMRGVSYIYHYWFVQPRRSLWGMDRNIELSCGRMLQRGISPC